MKYLILIPAIAMLTACGGGGGGGDSSVSTSSGTAQATPPAASTPPPAATPPPPPAPEPESNDEPEVMGDLVSDEKFDFIGESNLTLALDNNADASRVYLNVCNDFETVNGEVKVNYNTCQLRTTLPSGFAEYQLTIGGDVENLVAQVWVVEEGAVPANFYWSASEDDANWAIVVN